MNPYTLSPAPAGKQLLVIHDGPDAARATLLATAQGGRWVPGLGGWVLFPARAAKFCLLFDAGWTVARYYYGGPVKPWRYSLGSHRNLNCAMAIRATKRAHKPETIEV